MFAADAINKAKEFTDNVGTLDQLRNENTELKKLSESMKTELESAQKALVQAEQNLETERQKAKMPSVMFRTSLTSIWTNSWL